MKVRGCLLRRCYTQAKVGSEDRRGESDPGRVVGFRIVVGIQH